MRTEDAIKHFGGRSALARALKIQPESTYSWGEHVPGLRQLQLEDMTNGELRADPKFKPEQRAQ